ncbi:hypothetical protein SQ03_03465 [Methylobacterium platani JCM 14648]|uniref:Integral membrane bound transporter domain-containing protein n=3 Tax=Methylobacterium platani TaxID=427683 RepID=A0A179SDW8_9HYPH|nr:hypothetical protein SQ03_03465 [Methylobacterium platani JCM 14648]OAS25067.1 hypothetical protein A5481_11250 [Methylobacterium platani]
MPNRRSAAAHLLGARQFRDALAITSPPSLTIAVVVGVQAALSLVLAASASWAAGHAELACFSALGSLASLFGRHVAPSERRRIIAVCGALLVAAVMVPATASFLQASVPVRCALIAFAAGASTLAVAQWRLGGPGAIIFTFAFAGSFAPTGSLAEIGARALAAALGAALAWLVCGLTDRLRLSEVRRLRLPALSARPFSHEAVAAGRILVGAAIALAVAQASGWRYPGWAAVGALAVMQGTHLHITASRALQRTIGTVIGVAATWIILSNTMDYSTLIAISALFLLLTETIVGFNYGLGQAAVTPVALLMTYIAAPQPPTSLLAERLCETLLGAMIGIVLAIVMSSLDDRVHLDTIRRGREPSK